jgi:NinB protein
VKFTLHSPVARDYAAEYVRQSSLGYRVEVREPKRTDGQNDRFHAICSDIARSGFQWFGKKRTPQEWKVLLISGHAVVTKEGAEIIPGLEGELVSIRESTALMSVKRGASLIDYATSFAVVNGIALRDPALNMGHD